MKISKHDEYVVLRGETNYENARLRSTFKLWRKDGYYTLFWDGPSLALVMKRECWEQIHYLTFTNDINSLPESNFDLSDGLIRRPKSNFYVRGLLHGFVILLSVSAILILVIRLVSQIG